MNTGRGAFGRIEAAFDRRAEKFTFRHPYLTILIMFIAVPFGMLAAVSALTFFSGFSGSAAAWTGIKAFMDLNREGRMLNAYFIITVII